MSFKIQALASKPNAYQPVARHAVRGRVWIDVCKPVRRLSVAERIFRNYRTDNPDAVVRIRPVMS